jgi:hypothetical protein
VYLYGDRNKSSARDRYLVVSTDSAWCNIRKFVGVQLRRSSYRVRLSDCYKVSSSVSDNLRSVSQSPIDYASSDDEGGLDLDEPRQQMDVPIEDPPQPPDIPVVISDSPLENPDNYVYCFAAMCQ